MQKSHQIYQLSVSIIEFLYKKCLLYVSQNQYNQYDICGIGQGLSIKRTTLMLSAVLCCCMAWASWGVGRCSL